MFIFKLNFIVHWMHLQAFFQCALKRFFFCVCVCVLFKEELQQMQLNRCLQLNKQYYYVIYVATPQTMQLHKRDLNKHFYILLQLSFNFYCRPSNSPPFHSILEEFFLFILSLFLSLTIKNVFKKQKNEMLSNEEIARRVYATCLSALYYSLVLYHLLFLTASYFHNNIFHQCGCFLMWKKC